MVIVALTQSPPVADDRVLTANRASPREKVQRDHPGSALSSASGSAIKRITAGVRAAADRRCQVSIWGLAFTLPVKSVSNEKRILLLSLTRRGSVKTAGWVFIRPRALSFVKMRTWTKPQFSTAPSSCYGRASGSRSKLSSDAWLSLALGRGKFLAATLVPLGGYVRCFLGWGLQSSAYKLCRGRPI